MHYILMTLFFLVNTALAATINPLHAVNVTRDDRPSDPMIPTSHLVCGHFSTASHLDVDWVIGDLTRWPMTVANSCTTPARTCRRVGCENTSAVYVSPPPPPSSPPPTDSRAHRFATTRTRKSYSSASPTSPTGRAASTQSAAARKGRASRGRFSTTSGGTMWWFPMATATMAGIRTARAWGRPRIRGGRMVCAAYGTKGGTTALYAAARRLEGRHWRRGLGG